VSAQEHPVVLTVEEQIEWCYREHTPGQIRWLREMKWEQRKKRRRS
jgi:hypothetical protein